MIGADTMRHLLLLACFACLSLPARPLWLEVEKRDGSFRVERLPAALLHFNLKWSGVQQTPKTVKGALEQTPDALRYTGDWQVGKNRFTLKEEFQFPTPDRVEFSAALKSESPVETAEISLNFNLPLDLFAKKSVTVDGETIRYAETAAKANNRHFKEAKRVVIEMPEGKLEITGEPFRVLLQDNRVFAKKGDASPGSYGLRLYPQQGGEKECSEAAFRFTFTFHGTLSTPLDLSQAANRAFKDEVAGDGKGGWNDQGPENDLRMFQPGDYRFFGVDFRVLDPDRNGGRACLVFNGADRDCFLDAATVKTAAKGKCLYLLHANAFTGKYKEAGTISVKFRDGSTQEIPVRNRVDVANWWGGIDVENAPVVWKSANAKSVVGLYMTSFELKRDDPAEITFKKGEYPVWMIVAATLADRKAETYKLNSDIYILPGEKWAETRVADVKPGTALDLSPHIEAPAGKYGRVIVTPGGKLAFEKAPDKRLRLLGVNICEDANFPSKEVSEKLAGDLARAGYNTLRIHHFENGLHNGKGKYSYEFDPDRLDRLDYLIHCLKEKGIYVTFDLYASRMHKPGELPKLGDFKVGVCFHDEYLENWKEFTTRLLNHVNPYTKLRWADDPAFFCLNLVNENPLIKIWRQGDEKTILAEYAAYLERNRLDTPENRALRTGPFLSFLTEKQNRAIRLMSDHVRNTLGSKILITDINCDNRPYLAHSRATLELVDNHYYHDHPSHPQGGWSPPSVFTQFSSISRYAETPRDLMPTRIFGKPFIVTEYQFCHPNRFIAESGPLMGAYSALQDWDGLWRFQYSLSEKPIKQPGGYVSYFTTVNSPTMRLSDYIIYFLFIRGDARPAAEGSALPLDAALNKTEALPIPYSRLGLVRQIGILPPGVKPAGVNLFAAPPADSGKGPITSSTGEITLDPAGEFKVVTPKSECLATDRESAAAGRLSFRNGGAFQTLSLHTLDDRPIGESSSLLLLHLTDVKNSGEQFSGPDMTYLLKYGKLPILQEIGRADVSIRLPEGSWKVEALNLDGTVKGPREAAFREGALRFPASTAETLAYRITR